MYATYIGRVNKNLHGGKRHISRSVVEELSRIQKEFIAELCNSIADQAMESGSRSRISLGNAKTAVSHLAVDLFPELNNAGERAIQKYTASIAAD